MKKTICALAVALAFGMSASAAESAKPEAKPAPETKAAPAPAAENAKPGAPATEETAKAPAADREQLVSYGVGYNFGKNLKSLELELNYDEFLQGLKDAMNEATPKYPEAQTRNAIMSVQNDLRDKMLKKMREESEKNKAAAEAFLEKNKKEDGVVTLADGLQYKVLEEGKGAMPKSGEYVVVNYKGTFPDGKVFDTTDGKTPATLSVDGVIPGFSEALKKMKVGSKWIIWIPPNLGYGENRYQTIPGNQLLIFEVQVLDVKKTAPTEGAPEAPEAPVAK